MNKRGQEFHEVDIAAVFDLIVFSYQRAYGRSYAAAYESHRCDRGIESG